MDKGGTMAMVCAPERAGNDREWPELESHFDGVPGRLARAVERAVAFSPAIMPGAIRSPHS